MKTTKGIRMNLFILIFFDNYGNWLRNYKWNIGLLTMNRITIYFNLTS